jgi:TolB-like protein/class 3 adenylate cyclase
MKKMRQLAAIMFTDIEGYTALMQRDESKALAIRDKHREIFNSTTLRHHGKILQYFGDGTLSIFDSAIDAVECAIEMQRAFRTDPPVDVRIGIHLGDIIYRDDEIIGDGVNVASRVESMSVSGSILISDKVFDEVTNQESIQTKFMKSVKFKNVDRSMDIYAIINEGVRLPHPDELKGKTEPDPMVLQKLRSRRRRKRQRLAVFFAMALSILVLSVAYFFRSSPEPEVQLEKPENSIAVLAFENMSGDPDKEYFSDGISEEILNSLVQVPGLKVAGRTSAFSFKGTNKDIQAIGDALNVEMVLEGSIRKSNDRIRITAQLINVKDGFHMWSETYDRDLKDVFRIQEEIANEIAQRLKLELGQDTNATQVVRNMEAYDLMLKGIYFFNKDFEGAEKALDYFKQTVTVDSTYAEAYAWLGDTYINQAVYGFMPSAEAYSLARVAALESIRLNADEPRAHRVLAYVHLNYDWDWEGALREYKRAVELGLQTPDHFITLYDIFINQNYERSIKASEKILHRDPFHIQSHWHVGLSYFFARHFEEAVAAFDRALELDTNYSEGHRWKAMALAELERYEEAMISIEQALEITDNQGPANLDKLMILLQTGDEETVLSVLKSWEETDAYIDPIAPAMLYAQLGKADDAVRWLEQAYRERSFQLVSLKFYWVWDPIREHEKFREIYANMHFDQPA